LRKDKMIKALIFDFDGLILDTETPEFQVWQEIYKEHGCELPISVWAQAIGTAQHTFDPYEYLEAQLGQPIALEAVRQKRRERTAELISQQTTLAGVENYILEAKRLNLKVGLASSSPHAWVEGHLKRLGLLSYFDTIKCSDDVKQTKPDPELYLAVLKTFAITSEQAFALEDSPNGAWAAKRAGLFCVAIPNAVTNQLPLDHADLKLNSLAELSLEDLLQKIAT
jgi:HAD superfamily hydrolase (TIGR01509 family)